MINCERGICIFYMKKVTLVKLVQIEICCSLDGVGQKFIWTKSPKIWKSESIKDRWFEVGGIWWFVVSGIEV